MNEATPLAFGALLATLSFAQRRRPQHRLWLTLLGCLLVGLFWSHLTGEFARHWAYALFDAGQSVLTYGVVSWSFLLRYGAQQTR